MKPSIYINGNQGYITVGEVDEEEYLCIDVDFGFAVVRGGIPREYAIQLAHHILEATKIREVEPAWEEWNRQTEDYGGKD